jgi:hypothetical protein
MTEARARATPHAQADGGTEPRFLLVVLTRF